MKTQTIKLIETGMVFIKKSNRYCGRMVKKGKVKQTGQYASEDKALLENTKLRNDFDNYVKETKMVTSINNRIFLGNNYWKRGYNNE